VNSTVAFLEDNKVKVSVVIDEAEFEKEVDQAFKKIAKEVRLPGFRPGKAPRKVLEARIGKGAGREQALRDSLPSFYTKAVIEHDVDVIAPPEIEITDGQESGAVSFDAVVQVRPQVIVLGYKGLRVEIPSPSPSDDEVERQIDTLRGQFAELSTVERPAQDDDFVLIDIQGTVDGDPAPGLTASDYLYRVGQGAVVAELDANLVDAKAGDEIDFSAVHPQDEDLELEFHIVVKEVQERVLPEVDDDFAAKASGFATAVELREDIITRLSASKRANAAASLRVRAQSALAELVTDEVPDPMIGNEMQQRLEDLLGRLEAQRIPVESYLQMLGKTAEDLTAEVREAAVEAVKVDLALRAVVEAEGIELTEDELDEELEPVAEGNKLTLEEVRRRMNDSGQLSAIRVALRKGKALELVIAEAVVVDADGNGIDTEALLAAPDVDDADAEELDEDDAADSLDDATDDEGSAE
jgi:trigger factor